MKASRGFPPSQPPSDWSSWEGPELAGGGGQGAAPKPPAEGAHGKLPWPPRALPDPGSAVQGMLCGTWQLWGRRTEPSARLLASAPQHTPLAQSPQPTQLFRGPSSFSYNPRRPSTPERRALGGVERVEVGEQPEGRVGTHRRIFPEEAEMEIANIKCAFQVAAGVVWAAAHPPPPRHLATSDSITTVSLPAPYCSHSA